jgi:hypothetical protein
MKIHKLRFKDQEAYKSFLTEDHRIVAIATVAETGLIPYPTVFDMDGNPKPVTFREGYHVDVMTTEVIQEWKEFTVTGEHGWYHSFGYGEVAKEGDFVLKPNDSWLKADIQAYLTANGIEWTTSMTKAQLLELL